MEINDDSQAQQPPELLVWPCPGCATELLRLPNGHRLDQAEVHRLLGSSLSYHTHGSPYIQMQIDRPVAATGGDIR